MNIAPLLPSPQPPPAQQDRAAVAAIRHANPARDATDESERRRPVVATVDRDEGERLAARAEATVSRQHGLSRQVDRALASYARVADDAERNRLRDLLGFDAYA